MDGKHSGPALKCDSYFMGKIQTLGAKKNSVFIMPPSFQFCMLTTGKPSQVGNTSIEKKKVTIYPRYKYPHIKQAKLSICFTQVRHS